MSISDTQARDLSDLVDALDEWTPTEILNGIRVVTRSMWTLRRDLRRICEAAASSKADYDRAYAEARIHIVDTEPARTVDDVTARAKAQAADAERAMLIAAEAKRVVFAEKELLEETLSAFQSALKYAREAGA